MYMNLTACLRTLTSNLMLYVGGDPMCGVGGAACEKEAETGPRAAQTAQSGIEESLSERKGIKNVAEK
jgi:hypothetical protein